MLIVELLVPLCLVTFFGFVLCHDDAKCSIVVYDVAFGVKFNIVTTIEATIAKRMFQSEYL